MNMTVKEEEIVPYEKKFRCKNMNDYKCVIASEEMINKKWNQEIEKHEDKELWEKFKESSLRNIENRIVYTIKERKNNYSSL